MAGAPSQRLLEDVMLMIRELIIHKPGKVRPMIEMFIKMSADG